MADLRDLRAKITFEADCVLEARSRATGKDKSEIVREVLHSWALEEIENATVLRRLIASEGADGK